MPDDDISLLFNSLVVLPQDKLTKETETPAETAKSQPEHASESPVDSVKIPASIVVQETKAVYHTIQPFVVLTSQNLKDSYMVADSAFQKILTALQIPQAAKHLSTDLSILEKTDNYTCIWCIGLDIQTEKTILGLGHPNLLVSPDILSLNTTEEKKAMYIPLKAFVSTNMELITK